MLIAKGQEARWRLCNSPSNSLSFVPLPHPTPLSEHLISQLCFDTWNELSWARQGWLQELQEDNQKWARLGFHTKVSLLLFRLDTLLYSCGNPLFKYAVLPSPYLGWLLGLWKIEWGSSTVCIVICITASATNCLQYSLQEQIKHNSKYRNDQQN